MTIIGACLLAVLLVVAGMTMWARNRAGSSSRPADAHRPDDRARKVRHDKRAQSKHDRRKH